MLYAYQIPEKNELRPFLLLGTLVRALGKGWQVHLTIQPKHLPLFRSFQQALKVPTQFVITAREQEKVEIIPDDSNRQQHSITLEEQADINTYDLISDLQSESIGNRGVIAVTGTGKGKTTLGLGFAARSVTQGKKAVVIQWFKEQKQGDLTWAINEHQFPNMLKDSVLFKFYPMGLGFFGSPHLDRVKGAAAYEQHRAKAYEGLALAKKVIESGMYETVVLDEFVDTVKEIAGNIEYPLIDLKDLQTFLKWAMSVHLAHIVITGRRVTPDWQEFIKESVVISEVKHPWSSKGKGAVSGLDF